MAVTHDTTLRNALANTVDDEINTGAGTAVVRARDGSTTVVDFDIPNPAFGAAAAGVITLQGVPIAANAVAAGDLDNGQIIDRNAAVRINCSVTAVGGGGDIEVDNPSITNGQACSLTGLTWTAPA